MASYNVLAPPPSAAPTSAPFFPPMTAPTPAPAAVDPPTIIAVRFQSRPARRSAGAVFRASLELTTRRGTGAVCGYGSYAATGRAAFIGYATGVRTAYGE